ncbi:MAG: hypothetical protein HFI33_15285 [Lachnospiraceae bacterium]|nr:hypothetical protein [Lachnospiraceae bacterium]
MNVEMVVADRKSLNFYCSTVNRCMTNIANNILKIADSLYCIQSKGLFAIDGYKDIYSFASDKFGISKSTCYKYIGLREFFGLESKFSASQMIELLPYVRKGWDISAITPDMSVRQIRQFVKENFRLSSLDVETDKKSDYIAPAKDAKIQSFVFNITDELFTGPGRAYEAFFADIQTAVINAHKKFGAKSIKIVIE